ncbi:hypothetical protein DFP72DRAFT_876368 [Ephemerocybe angulata]|uniref:C2H2-type domain-containing protein n=1 Tax=Ephemerocybe angulata TaxID=980116 RepID=A0A8H6ICN2_9AGAR|nr:hypothetical protein DFP72DRAFT_876368 [Tulosesus angulatus]
MSRSPSPSIEHMPPRSDTGSPFEFRHKSRLAGATGDIESSPSAHSRDVSPSDSETSDSDHEHVKLPSIREFWSGRLPSNGSSLDSGLRDLGIGHPLPPLVSVVQTKSYRHCPLPLEGLLSSSSNREGRPESSSGPSFSPAVFDHKGLYQWRAPHPPTKSSVWGTASEPVGMRSHPYPSHGRSRSYSIDSESDDGYRGSSPPSERSYSAQYHSRRPPSQSTSTSHRSPSFDSDRELPLTRRTSVHSVPPGGKPTRGYHHSTSYSDYGSAAEAYRSADRSLANENWESYVEKAGRLNGAGPIMYTCRWPKPDGKPCVYTGKKQLAKRHVDSVHLGKKPHVCPECRKPFPQKTSLDIHIRSVHTFQKPLKCEHCESCFSDPARRHKHYRVEHPDKVVKKPRVKIEYKDIAHLLLPEKS